MFENDEPEAGEPARIFIYKGKEPRLSRHANSHFAKKGITIVLLPSNGRGDETNVINGGNRP